MATEADPEGEEFLKKLLLASGKDIQDIISESNPSEGRLIIPRPEFVIKTKNVKNEKIFLNICSSDELPSPKDISEEELQKLIDDPDALQFKVPIALGNPHAEVDKSGKGCTVYDVAINSSFLSKIHASNFFMGFFMTVVYEGIEDKYDTILTRDWVRLKNKKCIGQVMPQRIRAKSKPVIQEMEKSHDEIGLNEVSTKVLVHEKKEKMPVTEPSYKIIQEPPDGPVEYLVVQVLLSGVKSMKDTFLDVGDDRLILHVQRNKYHLDLKFPYVVDYETGGAQFNRKTKVLTITIPVLPILRKENDYS